MSQRVLVLGGARSGKSAFAEALLHDAPAVDYIAPATLRSEDHEWAARVAAHRLRRPVTWRTVETGDVAGELSTGEFGMGELGRGADPALIDSVTSWLARTMDEAGTWTPGGDGGALQAALDRLVAAWAATSRRAVAVSDEIGFGVVPETASGRLFRDTLGTLNQRLAGLADTVYLVVAGLPQRLK